MQNSGNTIVSNHRFDIFIQKDTYLLVYGLLKDAILEWSDDFFFKERFITQTVYTGCTRINNKIVSVTNLNKYLHYGTSGNE